MIPVERRAFPEGPPGPIAGGVGGGTGMCLEIFDQGPCLKALRWDRVHEDWRGIERTDPGIIFGIFLCNSLPIPATG